MERYEAFYFQLHANKKASAGSLQYSIYLHIHTLSGERIVFRMSACLFIHSGMTLACGRMFSEFVWMSRSRSQQSQMFFFSSFFPVHHPLILLKHSFSGTDALKYSPLVCLSICQSIDIKFLLVQYLKK